MFVERKIAVTHSCLKTGDRWPHGAAFLLFGLVSLLLWALLLLVFA